MFISQLSSPPLAMNILFYFFSQWHSSSRSRLLKINTITLSEVKLFIHFFCEEVYKIINNKRKEDDNDLEGLTTEFHLLFEILKHFYFKATRSVRDLKEKKVENFHHLKFNLIIFFPLLLVSEWVSEWELYGTIHATSFITSSHSLEKLQHFFHVFFLSFMAILYVWAGLYNEGIEALFNGAYDEKCNVHGLNLACELIVVKTGKWVIYACINGWISDDCQIKRSLMISSFTISFYHLPCIVE